MSFKLSARLSKGDAGSNVWVSVQRDQAVETYAHATIHSTRFSGIWRSAKLTLARGEQHSGKCFAGIGHDGFTVYGDLESFAALNALLKSH